MRLHWYDGIGLAGSAACLIALALLARGRLRDDDPRYWLLNLVGALGLLASLLGGFNISVFVMESAWAVVAAFGLAKALKARAKLPRP